MAIITMVGNPRMFVGMWIVDRPAFSSGLHKGHFTKTAADIFVSEDV